ncbi:hypothetical protein DFJ73DRAFT_801150 [Zopfochytrium polystomum]|nr:hypothetical protein DFJ73DRAFT_801150 [Zopfochytrium polystomum]
MLLVQLSIVVLEPFERTMPANLSHTPTQLAAASTANTPLSPYFPHCIGRTRSRVTKNDSTIGAVGAQPQAHFACSTPTSAKGDLAVAQWWKDVDRARRQGASTPRGGGASRQRRAGGGGGSGGLEKRFRKIAIDGASAAGVLRVLKWWGESSGPARVAEREYSSNEIVGADVLRWSRERSGFEH